MLRAPVRATGVALVFMGLAVTRSVAASPLFDLAGGIDGDGRAAGPRRLGGRAAAYFNPALLVRGRLRGSRWASSPDRADRHRARRAAGLAVRRARRHRERDARRRLAARRTFPIADEPAPERTRRPTRQPARSRARPRQGAGTGHDALRVPDDRLRREALRRPAGARLLRHHPVRELHRASTRFYSDEREQYFTNSLHPELYARPLTSRLDRLRRGLQGHRRALARARRAP